MVRRKHKNELALWLSLFIISAMLFIYSAKQEVFYLTIASLIVGCISCVFVAITLDKIHPR